MRVVVMEDYQRAVERLDAFGVLYGHDVVVHSSRPETVSERAAQIGDAEAIVLIRERTPIDAELLALVPHLRLICQTGRGMPHIDLAECTRRGIVVCAGSGSAHAPAELTLALILASTRCIVADVSALRGGVWQTTIGRELHDARSGSSATATSERSSRAMAVPSGCTCSPGDARRRSRAPKRTGSSPSRIWTPSASA